MVTTGFSNVHIATYASESGVVSYSGVRKLGRSVSMSTDISTSDDNKFYADDRLAETETGSAFTDGSGTCTVDGLTAEEEAFIMGLKAGNSVTPDEGTAVETYMWNAIVLCKIRFKVPKDDAETQGEQIDWQTQDLDFSIMRDDSAMNRWKIIPKKEFDTEAAAVAFIKKALGGAA